MKELEKQKKQLEMTSERNRVVSGSYSSDIDSSHGAYQSNSRNGRCESSRCRFDAKKLEIEEIEE